MNVKFVFANNVMANKSRPKRCVQYVAYLRPIKDAFPFLAATQREQTLNTSIQSVSVWTGF